MARVTTGKRRFSHRSAMQRCLFEISLPLQLLLLLLLQTAAVRASSLAASSNDDTSIIKRPCTARWSMLSEQQNNYLAGGAGNFEVRLGFVRGPAGASSAAASDVDDSSLVDAIQTTAREQLVGLAIRLKSRGGAELTAELSGPELERPIQRSLTVSVPRGAAVTVWQLVAAATSAGGDGSRQFGFENTAVTSGGMSPPSQVLQCTASYRPRRLIRSDTLVRLRHEPTGKYLVMRRKRGWEAAALGYSRQYRYKLVGVGVGDGSVRIEAETHTFGGYKFAYSSFRGNVYFDVLRPGSGAQLWRLSDPYPRDGEPVSIRNVRWPGAGLTTVSGGSSVGCIDTHNPDRWILEIA